ncbi:MAG: RNA polymerase sigma factor SigJ [Polyangiaceae bacterium]
MSAQIDWAAAVARERRHLFGVAYRMLGSASEAEDVLQEAWLRASASEPRAIESERAFLTTIVVRLCLDAAKSARARREQYVGPWLPEPLFEEPSAAQADETLALRESVSMALLVALEALSPLERAAYLLREVFDYEFADIAAALSRNEAACRQLHHRARAHLTGDQRRFEPQDEDAQRLVAAFLGAIQSGEVGAVAALLAADAISISDGGGKARAALNVVHGRDHVSRLVLGLSRKAAPDLVYELRRVNASWALVISKPARGDAPASIINVTLFVCRGGTIDTIYSVLNPEKLATVEHSAGLA